MPQVRRSCGKTPLMPHLLQDVTAVLMAKDPEFVVVKTRLREVYSRETATRIAEIMLQCVARRLARAAGRLVLAVTPDGAGPRLARGLGLQVGGEVSVLDQGSGDLGLRLDRVWRQVGTKRPVAFFGGDSPDVPEAALAEIPSALHAADVAVGPTDDGGYWTLAAREHHDAVLAGIDWGTGKVYDQTRQRAETAGLVVGTLPLWHDVDRPQDVDALRRRLRDPTTETALLRRMAAQLDQLFSTLSPREGTPS